MPVSVTCKTCKQSADLDRYDYTQSMCWDCIYDMEVTHQRECAAYGCGCTPTAYDKETVQYLNDNVPLDTERAEPYWVVSV